MRFVRRSYLKLQAYARHQSIIAAFGQRAIAVEDVQSLMESAVKLMAGELGVEYCKILEIVPDGSALLLRAGIGWREGLVGHATVESDGHSQAGYTLLCETPVIVEDFSRETRFSMPALLAQHAVKSGVSVIIHGKSRPFGILGAHASTPRRFSQDDVNFLQSMANVLAQAIEREETENKLQQDKAYYRALIENSSDIITVIDARAQVRFQSPSIERLLGYTSSEIADRGVFEFFHPEDIPAVLEKIQRAVENQEYFQEAYFRIKHKNGEWRIFHARGRLLTSRSEDPRLVINSRDVTESRKLETRIRELLNSAPEAMFVVDTHGTIGLVNSQAERLFGYAREELIGKPIEHLVPERFRKRHGELRDHYSSNPQLRPIGAGLELYGLRKDGGEVPVEISLSPVGSGSEMEIVAAIRDVTVRKETEKELIATREAALASARTKSEFLQIMSHELRTPLHAILGMSEMLDETELNAEQREYVAVMETNGTALLELINRILDLAKIEGGQIWLESLPFNLDDEIEKVISRLQASAHLKGLELAVRISPDLPTALIGDALRVRQILTNLIGNAIKFTHQGEIVVNVEKLSAQDLARTATLKSRGFEGAMTSAKECIEAFHFSVSDTGVGIPADKLDAIFSRFTQADSSTTRQYGGSGLGLAIAKHLVGLMGGTVWVESELNRGSTFHFTATFELSAFSGQRAAPDDLDLTGMSALVVDDTMVNRLILKETLAGLGALVSEAESGARALDEIRRAAGAGNPYQLVLLDHHMPGMDGLQVAQTLKLERRALVKGAIILMLSSADHTLSPDELRQLDIDRCLLKPLRRAEVVETISTFIGNTPAVKRGERLPARPLRILLADDSVDCRLLIKAFLKGTRCTVDEADNGKLAINKFTSGRYDLVLMDRQMPLLSGGAATRAIREWERDNHMNHTPIIALTAAAFEKDVLESIEAGCDTHLSKPVRKTDLLKAISRVISPQESTDK